MSGHDREMQPIDFAVQGEYSHDDCFLSVFLSLFLSTVCISSNHKLELYGSFAFGELKVKAQKHYESIGSQPKMQMKV